MTKPITTILDIYHAIDWPHKELSEPLNPMYYRGKHLHTNEFLIAARLFDNLTHVPPETKNIKRVLCCWEYEGKQYIAMDERRKIPNVQV